MAYGRARRAPARRPATAYPRSNRATASRRRTYSRRSTGSSARQQTVRIVLEAPGVRMPANTVKLPAKRKPF
ncbi:MAG: hypothetical protein [Arizlama microvirus]|nr:MAG: hypothetical protein [Arizlama microvirus]